MGSTGVTAFEPSDESLLQRIAERDTNALEAIYDRHAQVVFNLINRIVQDRAVADEIMHDTFWTIWKNAHSYRSSGTAAAWMYRIARNRSLDELRREKARPQAVSTSSEEPEQERTLVDTDALSVEDLAEHGWKRRHLRHALADIPVEQRQCLELAYFEGYSQSEIATQMGTPVGTVKTRMRIGLEKLGRILRSAGWEAEDV